MADKTGLLGGTFDPPHLGHLILAQSLINADRLDRVIFVPSGQPPHKSVSEISKGNHRFRMVELAIENNSSFEISDLELNKQEPCYTIDTVGYFYNENEFSADKLFWIIGADSLGELPTWFKFEELIENVDILTAYRGGLDIDNILAKLSEEVSRPAFEKLKNGIVRTPMIEISSSDIRKSVAEGKDIRFLVPDAVREYIEREGLYLYAGR